MNGWMDVRMDGRTDGWMDGALRGASPGGRQLYVHYMRDYDPAMNLFFGFTRNVQYTYVYFTSTKECNLST